MASTKRARWPGVVIVAALVTMPAMLAQQAPEKPKPPAAPSHFMLASGEVKWTNPPAGMARGTPNIDAGGALRYAPIEGDPLKPGVPFTILLGCADGYKAAPHWHPTDENIVVLKGTFALGNGDTFDASAIKDMVAGSYGFMPRRMHHFGQCKGDTEILIYGLGPFQINWISGRKAKNHQN